MKIRTKALGPDDILNPKGNTARDLANTALRAGYLSIVCSHWLSYQGETWRAEQTEPYTVPKNYPDAARYNKALGKCRAWDRGWYGEKRAKHSIAKPNAATKWDWPTVFNYWLTGALDRNIEDLLALTTRDNRDRVRRELRDF